MWRWLSIPIILLCSPGYGAPTSSGPTSEEEAKTLWQEGQAALADSRFQDASNYLQRYVDRYPGKPNYFRANFLLGKTLIELNKPQQAVFFLKNYLTSTGNTPESARARIWLGHAYLDLKKYNEAYLVTFEIDQMGNSSPLPSDILLESLLVKAQALLGLNHPDRTVQVLDSAEKQLSDKNSPEVRGQAFGLQLKLKTIDCARFPTQDRLDEGQVRDQLERRGICLLEALLVYHKILKTGDLRASAMAVTQISDAFDSYNKACAGPFPPPLNRQKKQSAQELRHYQIELIDRLKQDCKQKWVSALDLLTSWKAGLPDAMIGSLLQTTQSLEKSLSRTP